MSNAIRLEHGAPWTVQDLFEIPDDGQRYEVQDGALIMSPALRIHHNYVADELRAFLKAAAPPRALVVTGVAVRLASDWTGRVPDVVVAVADPGPDLRALEVPEVLAVVEVVSPGSTTTDRITKPAVYAAAGIPCFWRVELDAFRGQLPGERLPVVLVHQLVGDRCELVHRASAGTVSTLPVPYPVTLDPAALLP